ncbi:MAG: DUF2490 domain-containing protein, partial [Robiginitalea sp.]
MSSIRRYCLFILLIAGSVGWSQEDLSLLLQPKFSINYSLSPTYFHNFSVAQRVSFLNLGQETLSIRHIDLSHFSTFKWGVRHSVGLGVLYRFRELFENQSANELRLTQQLNIVLRGNSLRYGHRLRTEQRLLPSQTLHRFRYRFAVDGPLQGKKLNPGELYWIGGLEGLLTVGKNLRPGYSIRTSGWLGYLASNKLRIQIGGEYRLASLWKGNRP